MIEKDDLQTETRPKILQAATKAFAEKGLAGARVDHIAREAGINKAMIYYHFSSKENLYQEVINSQIDKLGTFIDKLVDTEADLESSLKKLSDMYNNILGSDIYFRKILLHELASGGMFLMQAIFSLIYDRGIPAKMQKKLSEGVQSGRLRVIDTRHAMISFVGMNLFYLIMAPIFNSILEINDAEQFRHQRPEQIVDLFLHGIEAR